MLRGLERRGHVLKRVGHLEGPCAMQVIRLMPNGVCVAGSPAATAGPASIRSRLVKRRIGLGHHPPTFQTCSFRDWI